MLGEELGVEKNVTTFDQARDEVDEGHLAGVGLTAEHALAEERGTQRHAVEPAHQFALAPALDRMRVAGCMERGVEADDLAVDPALLASGLGLRAGEHHLAKGDIARDGEAIAAHGARKPLGDVEAIERNDPAPFRRDPVKLRVLAPLRHRKHTLGIGAKDDLRRQALRTMHAPEHNLPRAEMRYG